MARRDAAGVRLLTRNGHDWASRFPLIVEAMAALRVRSCLIDGEAVCCDDNGMAVFAKLRQRRNDRHVVLYAFDLLELDGQDLRREPLERRKVLLARLLVRARIGLQVNDHSRRPATWCSAMPANSGRHRVEAARLALRLGTHARLAQVQEPGRPSGEAGGGRGLGEIIA